MQLLLNKASELPALLERYDDKGNPSEASNFAAVERLWNDFRNFLRDLREWELMLDSQVPSRLVWSRPNPRTTSSNVNVFWFPDIMTANSLTHFWAFQIIARTHLSILGRTMMTKTGYCQQEPFHTFCESDDEKSTAALAEKICDSMPYLMQPEMRLYGPASAFFTFPTAIQVFQSEQERYSSQLLRCQQIIERLASMRIHFRGT